MLWNHGAISRLSIASSTILAAGNNAVHPGFWIDHGQPTLANPTLPLNNRDAVLLLAALSTIVGFAAGWSRKIWRFILDYFILRAGNVHSNESKYSGNGA